MSLASCSVSSGTDRIIQYTFMPFIFKILKQVQAQAAGANIPIHTVGSAPTSTIVSSVRFYNSSGVAATAAMIYRSAGGQSPTTFARIICTPSTTTVFNTELTLAAGNVLEASTSAVMDIVACGVDRVP